MDTANRTTKDPHGVRHRGGLCVLACAGCLALGGCHLVPAEDVNTFLVDLAPRGEQEIDESDLALAIREETQVDDFEFAEELDTGQPRLPTVLAHVIRIVAGQ